MWKNIRNMSMSNKLPLSIIALCTSTAGLMGFLAFQHSSESLTRQAEASLGAVVNSQKFSLTNWLSSVSSDLESMRLDPMVQDAVVEFHAAWNALDSEPTSYLQNAYIYANPHPLGQKEELTKANDNSEYSEVHAKYHPYFRAFLRNKGYYDIFLFDEQGDLIYTVFKEADYATNLVDGMWSNTDLSRAFTAAKSKAAFGGTTFFDFKPYGPSADAPASFISAPIVNGQGEFLGVLAYQMPVGKMNEIMQQRTDLGESALSYIVGSDGFLRSDVLQTEDSDILSREIEIDRNAVGVSDTEGLLGEPVLRIIRDFEFLGTQYKFVTEMEKAELLAPTEKLRNNILLVLLLSALGVGLLGYLIARSFTRPIDNIRNSLKAMATGDLTKQVAEIDRGDEIGAIATTLEELQTDLRRNKTLEEEQLKVVASMERALGHLSTGDLTYRIHDNFSETYEKLRQDFNSTLTALNNSFQSVAGTTLQINHSAGEISRAADDLSRRSENQAATLEQTAAAVEEMTSSIKSTAQGASRANDLVVTARTGAEASEAVVEQAITAMGNIENSAGQITQIVSVIDDISFQTNLLALNAGVEAARAGEAGRGFAVVASEVRALAQRSSDAAKEIKELITESESHVATGVKQVNKAGDALQEILTSVREISEAVSGITSAAQEQSIGLAEINSAVAQLDQVTQQNAAMVEESTAASHALRQDSDTLSTLVANFKTSNSASGMAPVPERRRESVASPGSVDAQHRRIEAFVSEGNAALKTEPVTQNVEEEWVEF